MSDRRPLMPKSTAVWLVDNTSLSFEQIAEFCGMHLLEVKGIADGDVAAGIKGMDPVSTGQLTREEIKRAEDDPDHRLRLAEPKLEIPQVKTKRGPRYTPVSRRHDRPNAVLWLLRNHPELKDSQLMRLVGTTKPTIEQIRERTHWNSANLVPQDPVTLGLCSQTDLDAEVAKAAKRVEKERRVGGDIQPGGTLLPISESVTRPGAAEILAPREQEAPQEATPEEEEARVLAKLRGMTAPAPEEEDDEASQGDQTSQDDEVSQDDESAPTVQPQPEEQEQKE